MDLDAEYYMIAEHGQSTPLKADIKNKSRNENKNTLRLFQKRGVKALILCFGLLVTLNVSNRIIFQENFGGFAEWRHSGSQKYLYIEAEDSYSLGYLTGMNLWKEIWALKLLLIGMAPLYSSSYRELGRISNNYASFIPEQLIEEIKGIAHGASYASGFYISFHDILIQNVWYDAFYGQILPTTLGPLGCTAVGFKDEQNLTVVGQNFDLNPPFASTLSFVQHKLADTPVIFGLRLGGSVNLPLAKTSQNVTVLVTLVQTNVLANYSQPVLIRTRLALEQSSNALEFYSNFYHHPSNFSNCGFNLLISDPDRIIAIETYPYNHTFSESSLIVKTNTYLNPEWQSYLMNQTYSKERQDFSNNFMINYYNWQNLSENSILLLLKNEPDVCQSASNPKESQTLAYLTSSYFGLGKLSDTTPAYIPL
jgi:hypothetical protein